MVASNKTVKDVYTVLTKHVPQDKVTRMLLDLCKIDGNVSLRQTVEAIAQLHITKVRARERNQ